MARDVFRPGGEKLRRGVTFFREGRFEEAIAELTPLARKRGPLGQNAARHLGAACKRAAQQAIREGNLPQAQAHLRRAVGILGISPDLQDALAHVHAKAGQFDRAAEELQRALPHREDESSAWQRLAQMQWRAGQRAEAHMTLEAARRKLGAQCELYVQQGLFYSAENRLPEARAAFARAAEAEGESAQAHHYSGLAASAMGNHAEAVESLQRAAELNPNDPLVLYQLAMASRAAAGAGIGSPIQLATIRAASSVGEGLAPLELVEATLKPYEGRPEQSLSSEDREQLQTLLRTMEHALERQPQRTELHGYCAETLEALGSFEQALPHARQAVAARDGQPTPLLRLGKLCAKIGRHEEAVQHLHAALERGAKWADAHLLLGESLYALGRTSEARSHVEQALKLNGHLRPARDLRKRLAA